MWIKTGLKQDGRITAMHFRTALDGGAYGSYGVASLYYTGALQTVTYRIAALQVRGRARLHQQAALRAQARPRHAAAALRAGVPHRQVLRATSASTRRAGGCDNTVAPGTITANQMQVRTIGLRECLERVIETSG